MLYAIGGPPGSGKTAYVKSRRVPGDLIVDWDDLMRSLSGLPMHQRDPRLVPFVAEAVSALRLRLHRPHSTHDAWFIIDGATKAERDYYRETFRATVILLVTAPAVCKMRCSPRPIDDWDQAIDRWWALYEPPADGEAVEIIHG
jgi:hypothetical protein